MVRFYRSALVGIGAILLGFGSILGQGRLPITPVPLLFNGQGANLYLEFNVAHESRRVALREVFDLGDTKRVVIGGDEAHLDRLPLHVLARHGMPDENAWRGAWSARIEAASLPEYWAIDPIWAEVRGDTVLLVCDLATEESVGLYLAWWTAEKTLIERSIPVSGLDVELNMCVAPKINCVWQGDGIKLDFQDAVVRMDLDMPNNAFPGAWLYMLARADALDYSVRPGPSLPLSFGKFRYVGVADGLVLLDDSNRPINSKQAAKAAQEIAAQLGLREFDLVRGQAGVSAYFLLPSDSPTYQPVWEQHWLGRWEAGKWTPAPRPQ
jgi:hypothetical protein